MVWLPIDHVLCQLSNWLPIHYGMLRPVCFFWWLSISTLPEKGEESLDPSTKKQLKSLLSRWRTAPNQQPTNRETVHFQCLVSLQDLYLSGQATKSQGSTEHSCWGTSGITRGQHWPGMWWEYTWLINRWVVNTCREQASLPSEFMPRTRPCVYKDAINPLTYNWLHVQSNHSQPSLWCCLQPFS